MRGAKTAGILCVGLLGCASARSDAPAQVRNPSKEPLQVAVAPPAPLPVAAPVAPSLVSVRTSAPNAYSTCNGDDVFVVVDVNAQEVALKERLPMNLAVVIDRSGSMDSEHKLDHAKDAASFLVKNLTKSDLLGLVVYDSDVNVVTPSAPLAHPNTVLEQIRKLAPGSMTYIEGGLRAGATEVAKHLNAQQVNRVILLSDGLANVGVSDPRELGRIARSFAAEGIAVTTMGVGLEYNEETMMQVAELGRGNYHFIGKPDQIPVVFAKELSELKAVVALDSTLDLSIPSWAKLETVYGYDNVKVEGGHVAIPLGDLFSGDSRRITLRFSTNVGEGNLPFDARVHYRPASDPTKNEHSSQALAMTCTQDPARLAKGENKAVREELGLVVSAAAMDHAMKEVNEGRRDVAKQALDKQIQAVAAQAESSNNERFRKQVSEMKDARQKLDTLDSYDTGSAEVQSYVKGNRAASKSALKKR